MNPAKLQESLRARWRPILRELGLKCPEQRLAVLHEREIATTPMSHRDLINRIGYLQWDPTTTFRNLVDLFEAGLVSRFDVGDHTWRFELKRQQDSNSQHPHFLCTSCGRVTCLPGLSVAETIGLLNIPEDIQDIQEVLVKGRCREC